MFLSVLFLPVALLLVGCESAGPGVASPSMTPVAENSTMPGPSSDMSSSEEDPKVENPSIQKVEKSEADWKKELSAEEYHVLREKGTEQAFTGEYDEHFDPGAYACAACDLVLFESDTKFNSGCGWPAFYASKAGDRVVQTPDYTLGVPRTEVTCARCGSHLGHVFDDAPGTPTGQRYCVNSVSLRFIPKGKVAEEQAKETPNSARTKQE